MEPADPANVRATELPKDDYEWKKYGQKFIINIGKFRSFFKCQTENCPAKKQAEWSASQPGDLRVVFEGIHTHGDEPSGQDSTQGGSSSNANH